MESVIDNNLPVGKPKWLKVKLPIPTQIESVLNKKKRSIKIKTYEEFKEFLKLQ